MTRCQAIPGWEGVYEITESGAVYSVERDIFHSQGGWLLRHQDRALLSQWPHDSTGHLAVALCRQGNEVRCSVHVLVLETFVGPRPEGLWGLHRDGDPTNNHVSNLYWGTPVENAQDRLRHGTDRHARRTHCANGHEFTPDNIRWRDGRIRVCITCVNTRNAARYRRRVTV